MTAQKNDSSTKEFVTGWQSPANIALVKYWGKTGNQMPINPSLSITLSFSYTETIVYARQKSNTADDILLKYLFEGKEHSEFQAKTAIMLRKLTSELLFLKDFSLEIESFNTFPHSAGIASSASSMSALALCLLSIDDQIRGKEVDNTAFYKKASHIARMCSGSASRSVYGGFVLWGRSDFVNGSDNKYAIPLPEKPHPLFEDLCNSILIIDKGKKTVSSSMGHEKMNHHYFKKGRIKQANDRLFAIIKAIERGDWDSFEQVVENEALTIHGLMMSSEPGFVLIKANTINAIEKIIDFRKRQNLRMTFTIDAGPNIHIIYPVEDQKKVKKFIDNELRAFCEDGLVIHDRVGNGPVRIK
ncbi:MAG TPA: hypothetical protein PK908_08340 [Bacteroidales bacterium]|nr:hypothetical protein [Bacteroidales bacterium]